MKIKVEFEKCWSFEEIEEYLNDMENEKYKNMDFDSQVEFAACAYFYISGYCKSQNEMVSEAAADVAYEIEEFFFDDMWDNYVSAYNDQSIEEYESRNVDCQAFSIRRSMEDFEAFKKTLKKFSEECAAKIHYLDEAERSLR